MEIVCKTSHSTRLLCAAVALAFPFIFMAGVRTAEAQIPRTTESPNEPSSLYRSALIRERAIRTPGTVAATDTDYTEAITAFIRVAHEYPNGPYAGQALWQAAGLCLAAFERWHDESFIDQGTNLLGQLVSDYSHNPISHRVPERLELFETVHSYGRLTALSKTLVGDTVRYTLELSHETTFTTEQLDDPTRVFFDLTDTRIPDDLNAINSSNGKSEPSIRIGRRKNNTARVVLDLPERTNCTVLSLYEPFRIVADCHPPETDDTLPIAMLGTAPKDVAAENSPDYQLSLPRQLGLGISRVVIDPGHGGRDPGATGHGLTESKLTMDLAERVTTQLHASGIEVILTRQSDRFVPLEDRVDFATHNNADLFLSLHVNASQRKGTRGVETYSLDFAGDVESRHVAARENQAVTRTLSELDSYVKAITNSAKTSESDQLAIHIQQNLVEHLRTVDPQIPDLGIKHAPFIVLIGTQVPSVLVEIGFVSNPEDAALLKTEHFRNLVASAISSAVLQYQTDLHSASAQQVADSVQIN